jgi:sRNA-binding regulator protein Hfq
MQEIIKKHVVLSMSNGSVLEGFVESLEDGYFVLIEMNNQKVIVKKDDISFARLGGTQQQMFSATEEPIRSFNNPPVAQEEEYSMPLPRVDDGPYARQPEFVRSNK